MGSDHSEANRELKRGWKKYEELGAHISSISTKIERKKALGVPVDVLETELSRIVDKRDRLHFELSRQQEFLRNSPRS